MLGELGVEGADNDDVGGVFRHFGVDVNEMGSAREGLRR